MFMGCTTLLVLTTMLGPKLQNVLTTPGPNRLVNGLETTNHSAITSLPVLANAFRTTTKSTVHSPVRLAAILANVMLKAISFVIFGAGYPTFLQASALSG
jgi:hypothetical protein